MIQAEEIVLAFDLSAQTARVLSLLKKYRDPGMDLADACIVRMTELMRDCRVVTRTAPALQFTAGADAI